jgi:hypothetical protein
MDVQITTKYPVHDIPPCLLPSINGSLGSSHIVRCVVLIGGVLIVVVVDVVGLYLILWSGKKCQNNIITTDLFFKTHAKLSIPVCLKAI